MKLVGGGSVINGPIRLVFFIIETVIVSDENSRTDNHMVDLWFVLN